MMDLQRKPWRTIASALIISVLFLQFIIPFTEGQDLSKAEVAPLNEVIPHKLSRGWTREFGGGSYIKIDIGEPQTATLIFIWGNRDIKAPITIIARGVDVGGQQDLRNGTKVPVTSETVTVYRLEGLVEFEDSNKNGFYDPSPRVSTVDSAQDRIMKAISLSLAWTFKQRAPRTTEDGLAWEFSIEARNVTYSRNTDTALRQVAVDRTSTFVELIRFTFHLSVSKNKETGSVLEIKPATSTTLSSENVKDARREMEKLDVKTKMDHHISGWDFSSDNKKPTLMLKFNMHMGRTFDRSIIDDISDPVRSRYFGDPSIGIKYSDIPRSVLWEEGGASPSLNGLDTSGEGDIGMLNDKRVLTRFFWNDELLEINDAGGRTLRSNLQIYNLSIMGPNSKIWQNEFFKGRIGIGITITGAYIYPRALNIHHDPGIEIFGWSMAEEIHVEDDYPFIPGEITFEEVSALLAVIAVMILVAVAIILSLTRRRMDPGDEELRREEEEEIFVVKTRKRDWDQLRPK
jgi:hypothetical protein